MNIGQASKASGVSERMIRHYEKIELIPPAGRRDSGYRDYGLADLHRLRFIANARDLGFPIEDIRTLLSLWSDRRRSSAQVKRLALARAEDLRRKVESLDTLRRALLSLAERCQGDKRPECPIIDKLASSHGAPDRHCNEKKPSKQAPR